MATRYTDEFRRDAVRIAISSGLTLGICGLSSRMPQSSHPRTTDQQRVLRSKIAG